MWQKQPLSQWQPLCQYAFTAVMTLGLFAHWFIVFVLAPASYFKYYFPIYFTVYFWYILMVADTTDLLRRSFSGRNDT